MKKTSSNLQTLCFAAGLIFSFSSCYTGGTVADPYIVPDYRQRENLYYIPSAPNTPFHSGKNDMNLSAIATSDSKFSGGEVQASYMPGKNIGVIGSGSFASSHGSSDYVNYSRFELGAGYVTELSKNWHVETYAGFGNGKVTNRHHTGSSNIDLTHFFIQPAIAISNDNKNIQLGLVSKFAGVNFKVIDTAFRNDREPFSTAHIKSLYDQPFHIVWEPGLVFRFGWKNFQFHTGYSFSTDFTNPDLYKASGNFSLGICVRLNTADKKTE